MSHKDLSVQDYHNFYRRTTVAISCSGGVEIMGVIALYGKYWFDLEMRNAGNRTHALSYFSSCDTLLINLI